MVRLFSVFYYLRIKSEVSLTFCFHTSELLKVRWFASIGKSVQKTIERHVVEVFASTANHERFSQGQHHRMTGVDWCNSAVVTPRGTSKAPS